MWQLTGSDTNPGTQSSPVRTIQRGISLANDAINNNNFDVVVHIKAGSYREVASIGSVANTTRSLTLEGESGTVLTGSDQWNTGWTLNTNGIYGHYWPYKWGAQSLPNGWADYWNWDGKGYIRDRLLRREMIYINDKGLCGRLNLSELSTPGTFYVDETNSMIYLRPYSGTDMSTATIEVATRSKLLAVNNRANLTVRNLIIEKGRGSLQEAASNNLEINSSRNITLDGVIVRMAASSGFGGFRNDNLTIRNCKFNHNGISSLGQNSNINTLFEDSEIAGNNWRGWDAEHKGFGSNNKFFLMRSLIVRRVIYVNNYAHGLWLDSDNKDVLIDQIFSATNKLNGMYNEANQGPVTIQNSKFCGNETAGVSSATGSMNFNLFNNQIFDNLLGQIAHTGRPIPSPFRSGILEKASRWTTEIITIRPISW